MKVWVLQHYDTCECDTFCNCSGYRLGAIYLTKELAEKAKAESYNPHRYEIEEYEVIEK